MTRIAIAVAGMLAAGVGGFWAYRVLHPVDAPSVHIAPADAEVAPPPAEPARPAIPERVPDVTLADRDGKPRSLTEWVGRPLLVNFWATWCAPCRREIPLLKALREERQSERLEVIGIAVDFRDSVLAYAKEIGLDYPLLIGEQDGLEAAAAFGMDMVLPFSVFADREGRIVTVKVGELHRDEATYILDRIADVDAGRLALPDARLQIAARLKELAASRAITRAEG